MKKKRIIPVILAALLAALLISGCKKTEITVQKCDRFTLNEDDTITEVIIDELPEGETAESMQACIDNMIAGYYGESGVGGITLDECIVLSDGLLSITMTYPSANAYAGFNGVLCFYGTVKDAYEDGFSFQKIFTDASGNNLTGSDVSSAYWLDKILIVNQPLIVTVPGNIYAVSTNAAISEGNKATVAVEENTSVPEVFDTVNSSATLIIFE